MRWWCRLRDSNTRPSHYECDALPAELKRRCTKGALTPYQRRLVAATPGPGLMASAPPSPDTIPNNHFSYAIQWFLFAGIASLIYGLALRQRWRKDAVNG